MNLFKKIFGNLFESQDPTEPHTRRIPVSVISKKLSDLDINPLDKRHDEMEDNFKDLDFGDEVYNVEFKSSSYYEKDGEIIYTQLQDKTDGIKTYAVYYKNQTERKIKVIVDKFYNVFGEDTFFAKEYRKQDYLAKRSYIPIRWWTFKNYELKITQPKKSEVIVTVVYDKNR